MSNENESQNFKNPKSPIEDHSNDQAEIFRFIQDLEFVQLLSNPQYLECNKKINLILILFIRANCKWIFQRTEFFKLYKPSSIL